MKVLAILWAAALAPILTGCAMPQPQYDANGNLVQPQSAMGMFGAMALAQPAARPAANPQASGGWGGMRQPAPPPAPSDDQAQDEQAAPPPRRTQARSDVDTLPDGSASAKPHAYAIVIGIENYRQKLPKAEYAAGDAKLVSRYLTKVMGYPEENVVTLINDQASRSDFEKYFDKWLPNRVENGDEVTIYYSGHGAPNPSKGDAYMVPYDGDPTYLEETAYPLKKLYAQLAKLPAKKITVVMDSCFSGAGGRSVIAAGARPLVSVKTGTENLAGNITVLSAAAGDQISHGYDAKGHGLFTYFLLKGVKDSDGVAGFSDAFGLAAPQVSRIARREYNDDQLPQKVGGGN